MSSSLRNIILKSSIIAKTNLLENGVNQFPMLINVRFRKPRWLPIAKSKEFYVRKPTPVIPEEAEELYMRYSKYRAEVASIRLFLKEQHDKKAVIFEDKQEKDDDADLKLMEEQVMEWNSHVSDLRQKREDQEVLAEHERIEKVMQKRQEERLQKALEAEKQLAQNKAANFIQPDHLDEAIEVMLHSRSDYNYAVTNSGDIVPGEYPDHPSNKAPARTKMSDVS